MNLSALDLNLLVALEALLDEQNVTRAAKRLGLSQPATSHALGRLRDLFGDPLLVRTPRGMRPTARASELAPRLQLALAAVRQTLEDPSPFEPASSERTFELFMADQSSFLLLPRLLEELGRVAPRAAVGVRPMSVNEALLRLADGGLDLAIGLLQERPGLCRQRLVHERFVCVVRKGSRAARGKLTLQRYCELSHLLVSPSGQPGSVVDDRLAGLGMSRHVSLYVPHFLVAPHVVARTDLIWTAPARIAETYAEHLPLTLRPVPLELEGFTVWQLWHERVERDPAHRWFRELVARVTKAQERAGR